VDSGSDSACEAALAVDEQARRMAESIIRGIAAAA
jgi:1-deoxy-D-xylulose-5-phosphate reductoisomerase